ncbi:hypothetical protein [Xylophilus sp. ASV27]|nr:hypothetical protein [Xylophilus sp. ASV27]
MELRRLREFGAVARAGSMTRAAHRRATATAPPVGQHLAGAAP